VGVVPRDRKELNDRTQAWLRRGVIALATLALAIGVYALAAIVYRTLDDRLTPNRLTFIGWNMINIVLLAWVLFRQWRADRPRWLEAAHRSITAGMVPYATWAVLTLLALPWVFNIDEAAMAELPVSVQRLAFEEPPPILLKCATSPHVYLLDDGEKRWIKDISTFTAEGFEWRDVEFVPCDDIEAVPSGEPIPPDAGSPPEP
jgi:hypothetical protein